MATSDNIFRLELEGGFMQYNHYHDRWSLWAERGGRIDDIDANFFKTIREFKAWGQQKLNALSADQ